jgi:exodeoxyribonuclease VIII
MELMIDLESMSTKRNARIIQAGWAGYEPAGMEVLLGGQMNVDSDSCVGGHVSDQTFKWWLLQSEAARQSVAKLGVHIRDALTSMFYYYRAFQCKAVWSNGATFDIVIVEHWADHYGMKVPWKFYEHRDTRTIFDEAAAMGWVRERSEVAHTAQADSIAQARQVQSAKHWIRFPMDRQP